MNFPYAAHYKKRKTLKQYEYNDSMDWINRTYIDFLAFKLNHPGLFHIQIDFLGNIKTDKKAS